MQIGQLLHAWATPRRPGIDVDDFVSKSTQLDCISIGVYGSKISSVAQLAGGVVMLQRIRVKRPVRIVFAQLEVQ